jgi:hypothetical protein
MLTKTVFDIPISYNTANHNIKFCLSFGEGKEEEVCPDETERRNFSKNYDVEVFESGEGDEIGRAHV